MSRKTLTCSVPRCKEPAVLELFITDPMPLGVHSMSFCLTCANEYRMMGYRDAP